MKKPESKWRSWECKICMRTGFSKPQAHGCLNKPKDWKRSTRKATDEDYDRAD